MAGKSMVIGIALLTVGALACDRGAQSPSPEAIQTQTTQLAYANATAVEQARQGSSAERLQDEGAREAVIYYQPCDQTQPLLDVASAALTAAGYPSHGVSILGHGEDTVKIGLAYTAGAQNQTMTWDYHLSTGDVTGEDPLANSLIVGMHQRCDTAQSPDAAQPPDSE